MGLLGRLIAGAGLCAAGLGGLVYWSSHLTRSDAAPAAVEEARAGYSADGSADAGAKAPTASAPGSSEVGHPANANLRINEAGLAIIKQSEGLRLEAYSAGGRWYVGYGHSRTARPGMKITEAQAEALLREDVRDAEEGVKRVVTVPVNENEFSAMVSLAYNLGVGAFARSPVVARLNAGDRKGAADAFLTHNKAGGKVNEHLTRRRELERALFLS
ncbi:lysozyme [Amphiplicatus metriothermophilus]|uniref:Lysozyme n=1 Tax=Amphiplicatus metriothermophilus TaxID=1519374 RepID=A0A239Q0D5_9PROT|nr:lysozyme [Amphiplicatus metriothermophilus]MBB5520037.1 lysozyme [Amphiplicatus metriothermophilus]SNT75798.1 lysozyme [Amphiplicatus metriothermophilus]